MPRASGIDEENKGIMGNYQIYIVSLWLLIVEELLVIKLLKIALKTLRVS